MLVVKWTFDELYFLSLLLFFYYYYLSLLVMFLSWLSFDE